MSIDEQVRSDLFIGLQTTLGSEPARLMMSAIPPFSWDDVAKRSDLDRFATRVEFAEFRGEMRSEFVEFRGLMQSEASEFRGMMQTEFAEFRGMMQTEFADFRGQVQALISKGQTSMFFQIAALNLSTAGIVIAALKFLP
jgi:hypothetical protein